MKRAEWQYELDRRLVVNPSDVEAQSEWYIARLQPRALKYIILGAKAQLDVRKLCETRAKQFGIPLLEMRIGKRTYQPFFTVADGTAMMWDGAEFQVCADTCAKC